MIRFYVLLDRKLTTPCSASDVSYKCGTARIEGTAFSAVGWASERASGLEKLSDEVLVWLSVWTNVQIACIWSSGCHCHPKTPSSLASFKSRLVLPFWYRLTQVVLEKRPP